MGSLRTASVDSEPPLACHESGVASGALFCLCLSPGDDSDVGGPGKKSRDVGDGYISRGSAFLLWMVSRLEHRLRRCSRHQPLRSTVSRQLRVVALVAGST